MNPCTGDAPGVLVWRVRTDGFAHGIIGGCSGAEVLWKRVSGRWRMVLAYQDVRPCSVFRRLSIPSSIIAPHNWCIAGGTSVRYHHR